MDCDLACNQRGALRDEETNARDDGRGDNADGNAFSCAVMGLDWPGMNTPFVPFERARRLY
jgi:hypothetical protein